MDTSKSVFFHWFYAHQGNSCFLKSSNCSRHRGHKHISKKLRKKEKLIRNGAARTDEFRERFERHRTHTNIRRTVDGRRRPKKGPGPDLTEKWPSCVRLSTRKGSLLEGGPGEGPRGASRQSREGVREEVRDEVQERDAVEKTTPKSD